MEEEYIFTEAVKLFMDSKESIVIRLCASASASAVWMQEIQAIKLRTQLLGTDQMKSNSDCLLMIEVKWSV